MKINIPDRDEIRSDVAEVIGVQQREMARAWKWMRLPVMLGTPANSAVTIAASAGSVPVGPESGYAWSIRRIVVDGMTSGTTPDIVNMYRNAHVSAPPLWQFNGNNFGYTFGRLEVVLSSGDFLEFASVGTYAATGTLRVTGELIEVPAEQLWKLD